MENLDEVGGLLTIIEKCAGHTGKFSAIASEAMVRLLEINEECRKAGIARAEEAAAAEAERVAEEQERQAAEEEKRKIEVEKADEAARQAAQAPRSIPRPASSNGDTTGRRL
jgi:hypothetical protein